MIDARLLLSESARFPHGLAYGSDQLGRNYGHHLTGFVWGIFDRAVRSWHGAVLAGVVEDDNVYDPRRGFAGGYHLELCTLDVPTLPLAAGRPAVRLGSRFRLDH